MPAEVLAPALVEDPAQIEEAAAAKPKHATTYYPQFDWLRGVLASAVVLGHAGIIHDMLGSFAVQVFFALSGWLIGGILLSTERAQMPRFYYARATRIWIPYAIAFGLLMAPSLLRDPITPKYLEFVFYMVTFVYNLFATPQLAVYRDQSPLDGAGTLFWSICAEEQFYLLAPLLLVYLPRRIGRSLALWAGIIALSLALRSQYSGISIGVMAAIAQQRYGAFHRTRIARGVLLAVGSIASAVLLADVVSFDRAAPLVSIAIVLLLAMPGEKSAIGGFFGGISYPLYLNHWIGLFVAHGVAKRIGMPELVAQWLIGVPLAFGVASALYVLVDKRVMALRDRWYSPRTGRAVTIAAYATMAIGLAGGLILTR